MKFALIALRNLTRQKRRSLTLAAAIAFGVVVIALVNGFSFGTVRVLKENFAQIFGGHVFVTQETRVGDKTVKYIQDDTKIVAAIKRLGISEDRINRTNGVGGNAQIIFGTNKSFVGWIGSVDWEHDSNYVKYLGLSPAEVKRMADDPHSLLMNKKSANKLQVREGDAVLVKVKTVYGQENIGEFNVRVVTNDESEFNSFAVFVGATYMREILDLKDKNSYSQVYVRLNSLEEAEPFAVRLKAELAKEFTMKAKEADDFDIGSSVSADPEGTSKFEGTRLDVQTISDYFSFMTTISNGLFGISIVFFLILLGIIMVGIGNTFRMIIFERTVEIGTLRALGMQQSEVRSIMLFEALFLSLIGVIMGLVLAGIIMGVVGLVSFDTSSIMALFMQNGHLSFLLEPGMILIIVIMVSGTTLLAAMSPASKAAKLQPAEALRSTN